MIYTNDYESPLGNILLAGDEQGLTGLWFTEGGRYTGLGLKKEASRCEMDYFDQTKEWLDIYFSGRDPGFFAAKTLKRSTMPKYSGGATPVPMEPTSIIPNATAAHTAIPLVRLSM